MAEGLFGGAFFGNPNIQRQGARARALAQQRDVNTLPDPRTYAVASGLFGTAPDEMGFSVLNPQYEAIQRAARPAFALGTALGLAPALAPLTKGLPVGMSMKDMGSKIKVKPSTDDVYEVMDASFNYGKLGGNKTIAIDKLIGGVRMSDPTEARRVKELANKISSPEGYISRLIVDDAGNVLEGQHRLEALRLIGEKSAPVSVIKDLSNKYDILAMEKAIEGKLHPDQVTQMVKQAIDALEESGSVAKALSDYSMPTRFQQPFQDAIRASKPAKQSIAPQDEALSLAQQRAALPVEQGGLGLPANNTAMDRAKAMGFDKKSGFHGSAKPFDAFDPFLLGTNTGAADANMGFHFAGSRGDADFYATMAAEKLQKKLTGDGYGASGYVGEYLTRSKNPLLVDDLDSPLLDKFLAFEQAKKNNNDSIVFPYGTSVDSDYTRILFDPDNIRLKDAVFDPFRRNAAIAAAMGVAAPNLLAAPMVYTDPFANTIDDTTR